MSCKLPADKKALIKALRECISSGKFNPGDEIDDVFAGELKRRNIALLADPLMLADHLDGDLFTVLQRITRDIEVDMAWVYKYGFLVVKRGKLSASDKQFLAQIKTIERMTDEELSDDDAVEEYNEIYDELTTETEEE